MLHKSIHFVDDLSAGSAAEEPIRNQTIYIDKYKGAKEE